MSPPGPPSPARTRRDRCPGALRPWPAEDGLLVRLRLIGGRIRARSLLALATVADEYGAGRIHVTGRANVQLRALPGRGGRLDPEVLEALQRTGLLPSSTHELARNVMVSPCTGLVGGRAGAEGTPSGGPEQGGRADLRPVATALDQSLCATPHLAALPGRFLFVLDDGRGDLLERSCDLGLVALDEHVAQLRIGEGWGPLTPLDQAPTALVRFAEEFLARRGDGPTAPWHIAELPSPLTDPAPPDPRLPTPAPPPPYGPLPEGGRHVPVPDEGLARPATEALVEEALARGTGELIVTPWRGVLIPGETR